MRHRLATIALAPLLLLQGRHVRRTTPVLPEPGGPRAGVAGEGARLRLLVLGDSAAAGVGVATQGEALTGRIVASLQNTFEVHWTLYARTGESTQSALHFLHSVGCQAFDVAVTSLGVNDVTGRTPVALWLRLQSELAALLRSKFGVRHLVLSGVPPMHAFPALPQPLRWYLGSRAKQLDRALDHWVQTQGDAEYVSFATDLEPKMMAADGFHPGPEIYAAWGTTVAQRILARHYDCPAKS